MPSQVMEIINGLMEAGIKDNYSMEKDMVKDNTIALKINPNIMANGSKALDMVMDFFSLINKHLIKDNFIKD